MLGGDVCWNILVAARTAKIEEKAFDMLAVSREGFDIGFAVCMRAISTTSRPNCEVKSADSLFPRLLRRNMPCSKTRQLGGRTSTGWLGAREKDIDLKSRLVAAVPLMW